jgi:uncharacterized membrane protein
MGLPSWLLLSGIVVLVLAGLAARLSPALAAQKRWIRILGGVLVIAGLVMAFPDMVKVAGHGSRDARQEPAAQPPK